MIVVIEAMRLNTFARMPREIVPLRFVLIFYILRRLEIFITVLSSYLFFIIVGVPLLQSQMYTKKLEM